MKLRAAGRDWEWMGWGKGGKGTHFNRVVFISIILM